MPIFHTILCTLKYAKSLCLILSVLNTDLHTQANTNTAREQKDLYGGDGYAQELYCGEGIVGVCMCQNPSKWMQCLCISYASNKALKNSLNIMEAQKNQFTPFSFFSWGHSPRKIFIKTIDFKV